jgi:transposase
VAETRRLWSEAEKRAIVAEAAGDCPNISAVARRNGIKPSLLFRWKRVYGGDDAPSSPAACAFVPVALPPPPLPTALVTALPPSSSIEILLAGGHTVRVGADVDPQALARIVAALEARR